MKNRCLICEGQYKLQYKNLFDDRYGSSGKYSIYRCNNCGYGRLEPIIEHKKIGEFYAEYYPLFLTSAEQIKKAAAVKPKWLAWLTGTNNTAHWLIKPGSSVLDIGSGSNISLLEIKSLGGKAYGVDPNQYAEKIAKKLNLNFFKGFITDGPFPGKKFNFVTASQVIEHEQDPKIFLNALIKHLYQNGKIILSFPNADSLYRKIFGKKWINWHIPYHISHFTKISFAHLIEQSDFKIIKMQTITPNLWTVLQFHSLFNTTKEGEKNFIWSVDLHKDNSKSNRLLLKYKTAFLKVLGVTIMVPIIMINRIIDLLGQGDSFLVILEKNEQN